MPVEEPRTKFQKTCIAANLVLIGLFLVVYLYQAFHPGILIQGEFFSPKQQGDSVRYTGWLHDTSGTITLTPTQEGASFTLDFSPQFVGEYALTFGAQTDLGREVTFQGQGTVSTGQEKSFSWEGYYLPDDFNPLRDKTGDYASWDSISFSPYDWAQFTPPLVGLVELAAGDNVYHRGSWGMFALATGAALLFALLTAFPLTVFWLSHFLEVQDPEPTDLALLTMRIAWVVGPVAVLVLYCIGLSEIV